MIAHLSPRCFRIALRLIGHNFGFLCPQLKMNTNAFLNDRESTAAMGTKGADGLRDQHRVMGDANLR